MVVVLKTLFSKSYFLLLFYLYIPISILSILYNIMNNLNKKIQV